MNKDIYISSDFLLLLLLWRAS